MFDETHVFLITEAASKMEEVKAALNKSAPFKSPITGHRVVNQNEMERLAKVFNLTTSDTTFGGVTLLTLEALPIVHPFGANINFSNMHLDTRFIQNLVQDFANRIKRNVDFSVPHGKIKEPKQGPEFNIFIWSAPTKSTEPRYPKTMWGIDGDKADGKSWCNDKAQLAVWNAEDVEHIKSPEGDIVASFNKNNLYIYHDAVHNENEKSRTTLKNIMDLCDPSIIKEPSPEILFERNQQRYVEACLKYSDADIKALKNKIKTAQNRLETAKNEFVAASREATVYHKDLIKTFDKPDATRYVTEFGMLSEHPDIESINICENLLKVYTKNITIKNKNIIYDIGKFAIDINLTSFRVQFSNLTRKVDTKIGLQMHHPHVFEDGRQCLGTAAVAFAELIAAHEYGTLIDFAIAFLKQANIENPSYMSGWPIIEKEVKETVGAK